jgi:hypothetical protein
MLKRWRERERERERERTFFGSFASCMSKKQAHKVSDMDAGHLVAADFFLILFLSSQMQKQVCSYFLMVHKKLQSLSGVNYVIKTQKSNSFPLFPDTAEV